MGQVVARSFALEGATVAVGGRHKNELDRLAHEIDGMAVDCDITNRDQIRSSIQSIIDLHAHLDVAVDRTGIGLLTQFEETS